jgi:hypothetical protein
MCFSLAPWKDLASRFDRVCWRLQCPQKLEHVFNGKVQCTFLLRVFAMFFSIRLTSTGKFRMMCVHILPLGPVGYNSGRLPLLLKMWSPD